MPRTVHTPRIDVVRWSQRMLAVYDAVPGKPGAWLLLLALKNQANWLEGLRDTVTIAAVQHALVGWDHDLASYRERLKRYRHELELLSSEEDPVPGITSRFMRPVFDGDYSDYLADDGIEWPYFRDPSHPDVMTGAMLWNQMMDVLRAQQELEPTTWEFMGCAAVSPIPAVNLAACRPVLLWAVGDWMVDAEKQLYQALPDEPATIRDQIAAAVENFSRAAESLFASTKAAARKLSWVLYLVGGFLFVKAGARVLRKSRRS